MYAHVVFPIASYRSFSYKIPKNLYKDISIGSCVDAKFKNRLSKGYVVEITDSISFKGKIHNVVSINKSLNISKELLKTIKWIILIL